MKETSRHITGYLLGFTMFIILIPLGLIKLTALDYIFDGRVLISQDIIRYILTSLLFINGAVFAIWSNFFLLKVGEGGPVDAFGVSISPQSKKLVTTGPYRYSRNPMVFGAFSLYMSIAVFLNSIAVFTCLLVFLGIGVVFLKFSEEKRLLKDFGDEYKEYRKQVPMIFPFLRRKKINQQVK
jgi:protein-S-isoprenylcysteine O-methyltransferase Ste14